MSRVSMPRGPRLRLDRRFRATSASPAANDHRDAGGDPGRGNAHAADAAARQRAAGQAGHGDSARPCRRGGYRTAAPQGAGAHLRGRASREPDGDDRRRREVRVQGASGRPLQRVGEQGELRRLAVRPAAAVRGRQAGRDPRSADGGEGGLRAAARRRHHGADSRRVRRAAARHAGDGAALPEHGRATAADAGGTAGDDQRHRRVPVVRDPAGPVLPVGDAAQHGHDGRHRRSFGIRADVFSRHCRTWRKRRRSRSASARLSATSTWR